MDFFHNAFSTYLFLIPLIVMLLSELAKVVTEWYFTGSWQRGLFQHGGMPSSHSAFVTSLLIVVGRKAGLTSVEFAMAMVFANIVWYDAIAIRGTVGKQGKVLNLLQELHKFSERIGHSFVEVIAGIAFGAVVTMLGILLT